jgi:hypothetical protein
MKAHVPQLVDFGIIKELVITVFVAIIPHAELTEALVIGDFLFGLAAAAVAVLVTVVSLLVVILIHVSEVVASEASLWPASFGGLLCHSLLPLHCFVVFLDPLLLLYSRAVLRCALLTKVVHCAADLVSGFDVIDLLLHVLVDHAELGHRHDERWVLYGLVVVVVVVLEADARVVNEC